VRSITPREIKTSAITRTVAELCLNANLELDEDVLAVLKKAEQAEESPLGKEVLRDIIENARIAREERLPLCQDCGIVVIFLEVGQDVHVTGDLYEAITEGVRQAYTRGYLRKSIVLQPLSARANTGDNTPPIIHTEIVPGDRLKIACLPKGAGTEMMSRVIMLKPADGRKGVIDFVVDTVRQAGGNPCPPLIVGVGIGATAEVAMLIAKKVLLRRVGEPNPDPEVAGLEAELLAKVNDLGIGPLGLGGRTTALAVHVEVRPTHIATLPVAVSLQCHSVRHREAVL
jgi:fumarate hydratase subunit alpha